MNKREFEALNERVQELRMKIYDAQETIRMLNWGEPLLVVRAKSKLQEEYRWGLTPERAPTYYKTIRDQLIRDTQTRLGKLEEEMNSLFD